MRKLIIIIIFCIVKISVHAQVQKIDCTENHSEEIWLNEKYEFMKFCLEEEKIQIPNNAFWIFGISQGEVSQSYSALISTSDEQTIIFQFSPLEFIDKEIIKKKISIDNLIENIKDLDKNVDHKYVPVSKYFVLFLNQSNQLECLKKIYSTQFPPSKNNDDSLIDFNLLIDGNN